MVVLEFVFASINKATKNARLRSYKELKRQVNKSEIGESFKNAVKPYLLTKVKPLVI